MGWCGWSGVAAHLVVAVLEVVLQGGLGGGVHGAGLGESGLALQVLDRGGGLRAHQAIDGAFVVVQLAELLLELLHRRRRGASRVGGVASRGGGRGGAGGRGARAVVGQADDGQDDQGRGDDSADNDGPDPGPGPVVLRTGRAVAGVRLLVRGLLVVVLGSVVLGTHDGGSGFLFCSLLIYPVSAGSGTKTLGKLPSPANLVISRRPQLMACIRIAAGNDCRQAAKGLRPGPWVPALGLGVVRGGVVRGGQELPPIWLLPFLR